MSESSYTNIKNNYRNFTWTDGTKVNDELFHTQGWEEPNNYREKCTSLFDWKWTKLGDLNDAYCYVKTLAFCEYRC